MENMLNDIYDLTGTILEKFPVKFMDGDLERSGILSCIETTNDGQRNLLAVHIQYDVDGVQCVTDRFLYLVKPI